MVWSGPLFCGVRGIATLTDPQWADTTVLSGDVAAAVGELKAKPAGELLVHGSGNPVRWLFDNELVDEITLLTYPVVIGQGTRLFPDTGPGHRA
jgi:dihydrofolate reductase